MRLVKKTVNQDDVSAYHLFYADGKANPGTDLTFFDFPAAPEQRGTNAISRTGLRVSGEKTLGYWRDRLKQAGVLTGEVVEVDGRLTLPFEDGEGQRLVLVDDGGAGRARRGKAVRCLRSTRSAASARSCSPCRNCRGPRRADGGHEHAPRARLCRPMEPAEMHVFAMGEGGPAAELHVLEQKCAAGAAGRGRRAPRRVPHAGRGAVPRLDAAADRAACSQLAARSTASISAASISASRTASCSRSRPTVPALPPTSRWTRSAKNWRCRRSSNRAAREIEAGLKPIG